MLRRPSALKRYHHRVFNLSITVSIAGNTIADDVQYNKSPVKNCQAFDNVNQEHVVDFDDILNDAVASTSTPELVPNTQYEDVFSYEHNVQNEYCNFIFLFTFI
ncbi:hypothetical protein L2E82_31250 [Cichorium intybus]|uniref:Uncharacterized protein n=1 Tax=Cichorium intybus TaxID=13427 RepID=A0ACB9D2H8_CICIN|nr:hypothetical protein L2E82_31250 [Cichorium intybus]